MPGTVSGARPLEDLTEETLIREGVLVFVNGRDLKEGVRLSPGRALCVGGSQGVLQAHRILGTGDGVIFDPGLEPLKWEVIDRVG